MEIVTINALQDNFMYVLIDTETNDCAVVDPVDSKAIYDFVTNRKVNVKYVLTTHHHWDHAGGNKEFVSLCKELITVVGGDDRVEGLTKKVGNGDILTIGKNVEINCLFTPCHTKGHICYVANNRLATNETSVFTGDTLFIAGCGRFFEGTPIQMYHALVEMILDGLPSHTRVWCGHEYTVKNLRFALTIEPANKNIQDRLSWSEIELAAGRVTVPSTMAIEALTNPFVRVREATVQVACGSVGDPVKTMEILRARKDNF